MSKKVPEEAGGASSTPLSIYDIISSNRLGLVRDLIALKLFIPDPEDGGNFPVHTAIAAGDNLILKMFIDHFGEELLSYLNFRGENALHFAARIGASSAINLLLPAGFEVNYPTEDGKTPMMLACASGAFLAVRALGESRRVDYNVIDNSGKTCWHYAIENFVTRKNYGMYKHKDIYGGSRIAYLIPSEAIEILRFLSIEARDALTLRGVDADFAYEIPLDILRIKGIAEYFNEIGKKCGIRFNYSDEKILHLPEPKADLHLCGKDVKGMLAISSKDVEVMGEEPDISEHYCVVM